MSVQVYTAPGCSACRTAKDALRRNGIAFEEVCVDRALDEIGELDAITRSRVEHALGSSIPQIYVDGALLGSLPDLDNALAAGSLLENGELGRAASTIHVGEEVLEADPAEVEPRSGEPLNCIRFASLAVVETLTDPVALADALRRRALRLLEAFYDGRDFDATKARNSKLLREYVSLSSQLGLVKISEVRDGLTCAQRKALFINLYNAMVVHARCVLPRESDTPETRSHFFKGDAGAVYAFGPHLLSLDDIEHGILRGNHPHPSQPPHESFLPLTSALTALSLPDLDPRIHFALNCGARSCPPIRTFNAENIDSALDLAAAAYLSQEIEFLLGGVLVLPKLLLWYWRDFGETQAAVLSSVAALLRPQHEVLASSIAAATTIQFADYDWSPNIIR